MSKIVSYALLIALTATMPKYAMSYPNDTDWRQFLPEVIQKEIMMMPVSAS